MDEYDGEHVRDIDGSDEPIVLQDGSWRYDGATPQTIKLPGVAWSLSSTPSDLSQPAAAPAPAPKTEVEHTPAQPVQPPPGGWPKPKKTSWWQDVKDYASAFGSSAAQAYKDNADNIQMTLDVAGMVPVIGEVADGLNAAICLVRGDYVGAVLSAGATMPFAGNVATAGKWARKGANAVEAAGKAGKHADTARSACKGGEGACFTEGTQIVVGMTYDENDVFVQYVTANIEDIQVGDWVYSYDTITGEVSQQQVTAVFVRESDHINYLTISDEGGNMQVIETTDGHPFWVVTDTPDWSRAASDYVYENGVLLYHENLGVTGSGYWVESKDLREGDVFIGANGELCTLTETERVEFPDGITVYNFEVAGNHNYYVIANVQAYEYGATTILVHNAGYDDWLPGSWGSPKNNAQKHFEKHGAAVGAKTIDDYYEMASEALDKVKGRPGGQPISGATLQARRYKINNKTQYLDVAPDPENPIMIKILSFGALY